MDRVERNGPIRDRRNRKLGMRVTVVMLAVAIGTVLLAYTAFASPTHNDVSTLRQVIFVFRHGDRTPTETYPNDPYRNHDWPGGWGALTKKGMFQMYNVGRFLRNEYGTLIGKKYESNLARVESSYADRCIMSAQALLAGLFPPEPEEVFVPGLAWRPVPVHSTPRHLDKVIVVKAPCPRLDGALEEAYANESAKTDVELAEYYKELSAHTGQNMTTITDVEFLYNTLEIEEQNGLRLPEWTTNFYNDRMRHIASRGLAIFTSNTLQQRLRGGPLLKDIVGRMRAAKDGGDRRTVYMYSAHDITLVNLLRTMGFTSESFKPDYGATLIFELHTSDRTKEPEVKVLYLNSTEASEAHPMRIPKCGTPCLLGNAMNVWRDVMPNNWDSECQL